MVGFRASGGLGVRAHGGHLLGRGPDKFLIRIRYLRRSVLPALSHPVLALSTSCGTLTDGKRASWRRVPRRCVCVWRKSNLREAQKVDRAYPREKMPLSVPPVATVAVLLGKRVAAYRKRADVKQAGLGGCSASTISRLEQGDAIPPVEVLERIALALDVTLADFFTFGTRMRLDTRHQVALRRISYILRARSADDAESILTIMRCVFEIRRRPQPQPRRAKPRKVRKATDKSKPRKIRKSHPRRRRKHGRSTEK